MFTSCLYEARDALLLLGSVWKDCDVPAFLPAPLNTYLAVQSSRFSASYRIVALSANNKSVLPRQWIPASELDNGMGASIVPIALFLPFYLSLLRSFVLTFSAGARGTGSENKTKWMETQRPTPSQH